MKSMVEKMCKNKLLREINTITINQTAVFAVCHWENKFSHVKKFTFVMPYEAKKIMLLG